LSEDLRLSKRIVVCTEPRTRTLDDGVVVMPAERFMQQLWGDQILEPRARAHASPSGTTCTAASGTAPRKRSSVDPRQMSSQRVRALWPKITCVTPSR
jgi:hypothetical protein